MKKVEKWPKNHYLATLGIYLQFHDFQSFSKKITEKILTAWCSNWWSQYVRKFNYFLNNIPKIILGGGKTVKKFEKTLFFLFFGGFFLMKHQREAPPPWVGDEWIFGVHICNPIPFLNTSVPFFQKLNKNWPNHDFFSLNSIAPNSAQSFMIFKVFLKKLLRKYLQPDFLTDGCNMFENVNTFRITYQKLS